MNFKIIATDFDGTLCENKWPEIGAPNTEIIKYLKRQKSGGDVKLILWTCRVGERLKEAVHWCYDQGLIFDAVNENIPEAIDLFGSDTRKIFAHEYIDDRMSKRFKLPFVKRETGINVDKLKKKVALLSIWVDENHGPYYNSYICERRKNKMPKINETLIIGVDFSENGDTGVITVGRQINGKVDIINVFRGKDAEELYSKLEGQKTHNIKEEFSMSSWAEKEVEIACKHEYGNTPDGEWDYGCACYESALKAYKSLIEDDHSGFSIGLTKHILNRLIDGKPLTPIEDTDDIWSVISDFRGLNGEVVIYQCKRISSLFKYVYTDGTVEYKDVNRYYCVDINNEVTYHSSLVQRIIDEMFPITMPYFPEKPIKVYCEDFFTDRKNGDFDTVGIFYAIKPDGEKVEINRFFKYSEDGWKEIDVTEYIKRKGEQYYNSYICERRK